MAIIYNIDQLLELNININQNEWVLFLICIPGLYLLGRVSLLFPAKAIDEKIDLKKSWEITKNNGWRIFVIIGFYPWILGMIIWLVWGREEASLFEDVISSLLTVLILALEVVALSFTYKELVSYKAKEL